MQRVATAVGQSCQAADDDSLTAPSDLLKFRQTIARGTKNAPPPTPADAAMEATCRTSSSSNSITCQDDMYPTAELAIDLSTLQLRCFSTEFAAVNAGLPAICLFRLEASAWHQAGPDQCQPPSPTMKAMFKPIMFLTSS